MSLVSVLRVIVLVLAAGPLVYYLLSLYCVIEYFVAMRKMPPRDDSFAPPVSILKAVRGVDHDAYENFASYCRLDYPEYELVFAMADRDDPVIPVIEKLKRDFPDTRIAFVTDVARIGENNKVNSLCRLVKEAKHNLMVMTDSDVRVERDYLREVVAPFADEAVGGVTSFYRCKGGARLPRTWTCWGCAWSPCLARWSRAGSKARCNLRSAGRWRRPKSAWRKSVDGRPWPTITPTTSS